jgi:hypothetical protein
MVYFTDMPRTKHLLIAVLALTLGGSVFSVQTVMDILSTSHIPAQAQVIFASPKDTYPVVPNDPTTDTAARDQFIQKVRDALRDAPEVVEEVVTTPEPVVVDPLPEPIVETVVSTPLPVAVQEEVVPSTEPASEAVDFTVVTGSSATTSPDLPQ